MSMHPHSLYEAVSSLCAPWHTLDITERFSLFSLKQEAAMEENKKREESRDTEVPWCESLPFLCCWPLSLHITHFFLFTSLPFPDSAKSCLQSTKDYLWNYYQIVRIWSSKHFALDITLETFIYCPTKVVSHYTEMWKNVRISFSNLHRFPWTFHCTERHRFSLFLTPAHRSHSSSLVFTLFTMHSLLVTGTHILFPTPASQALPWDMSALKCLSSQTTGPACHHEAARSCWLVPGSLAMQGAQALIGMKAMKTQEEQMPAQPCTSADTFHAKPLHCHHRIWTRINDSESLFLFIQVHVAVSFCTEKQVPGIASAMVLRRTL